MICAIATYANRGPAGNSTRIVAARIGTRLTRNRAEPTGRINDYGGYACRRQRAMIQTKLVIIATTLNTIRYSIVLSHCLTGDETGVSALGTMSRSAHPGQGCPQRSQLQPACASVSLTGNSSNATSFNISLVISASLVNNRAVFIESLLVR